MMRWTAWLLLLCGWPTTAIAQPADGGAATLIAVDADGAGDGSASADGRFIAASSTRSQGKAAIWLFDRRAGTWRRLTTPGNGDREPAVSPDGRFVAYVTDRNGRTDLWAVDVASGREFPLTSDAVEEEYPAWSHDGRRLVFTGGPWKARNFYTLDFAGPKATLSKSRAVLAKAGHVGACRFKDGNSLICHVYDGNAGDIVEIDTRTRRLRTLTHGGWWFYKPDVAPDGWIATTVIGDQGDTIRFLPGGGRGDPLPTPAVPGSWPQFVDRGRALIYHRQISEGTGFKLIDLAGGGPRDIAIAGEIAGFAALSPDGGRIAYCRKDAGRWSVRLRTVAGGADRALPLSQEACNPAWSPDGHSLAVSVRTGEHWAQGVVRDDGTALRILQQGSGTEWQLKAPAAWSPDGRRLAFAVTTAPYESDLFVADLATGAVGNVTNDAWYDEGPSWSADGRSIVFMSTRGGSWTWGLFAIPVTGGEPRVLVAPDSVERRFPQLDADGTIWWIESDLCLGATYLVRQPPGAAPKKFFDTPGVAWFSRTADGKHALLPITRQRVEYWSMKMAADKRAGR